MRKIPIITLLVAAIILWPCQGQAGGVDNTAGYLYWANSIYGEVWRSDDQGLFPTRIVPSHEFKKLALGLDLVNQKLYYSLDSNLMRSNLDGTGREVLVTGSGEIQVIKVDPTGKVYWAADGEIFRADLDGNNSETLVAGISGTLNAIALDLSNSRLYYEEQSSNPVGTNIVSVMLDGSDMTTAFNVVADRNINGIAVDPVNQKIYFSSGTSNFGLRRADFDGMNLELAIPAGVTTKDVQLVDGKIYFIVASSEIEVMDLDGQNRQSISSNLFSLEDFRLDNANGQVYLSNIHIRRSALDGTGVDWLIPNVLTGIHDIAVDPAGETLFFTDFDQNTVFASRLDVTPNSAPFVDDVVIADLRGMPMPMRRLENVRGLLRNPDGGALFWVDNSDSGGLYTINPDGSGVAQLLGGLALPHDLGIDPVGGRLYWVESIEDSALQGVSIKSATLAGADVKIVHTNLPRRVRGLTVDSTGRKMYWTDMTGGEILRSNLNGSTVETILTGLNVPHDVAVDEVNAKLYWSEGANSSELQSGAIGRSNLNGSSPQMMITGLSSFTRDIIFVRHRLLPLFADSFEALEPPEL